MTPLITPLIACGGSGSRLLPVSCGDRPKQFLRLVGEHSSFQETLRRVADADLFGRPLIITQSDCEGFAREQLAALGMSARMLLEPDRRNSGPAILAGALYLAETQGPDATVLALAADHRVRDADAFRASCRDALAAAAAGAIVTFGIRPDHPATGYGYIEPGVRRHGHCHEISRFIEKPAAVRAARLIEEGLLWNSGNFLFRAAILIDEYRSFDAATVDAVAQAVRRGRRSVDALHLEKTFALAESRSLDHAVMEKTRRAMVVTAGFDWADIGSWPALHRLLARETDSPGNRIRGFTLGPGEHYALPRPLERAEYWIVAEGCGIIDGVRLEANGFERFPAGARAAITNVGLGDLRLLRAAVEEQI